MKWLKNLKTSNKSWLTYLSELATNTIEKPDDSVLVNDCFAIYLQKMATDSTKPLPSEDILLSDESLIINKPNTKHADKLLNALSPLKQAV